MLCSLEHNFARGQDTKQLLYFLIQYIHNTYPAVKVLQFNDLSTRKCDNMTEVNLAVMAYLYTEKTWYEKNFSATIAKQSKNAFDDIIIKWNKSKIQTPWYIIKDMIYNYKELPFTEKELEELYNHKELQLHLTEQELISIYKDISVAKITSWKDFFEPIFKKIGISQFCIFVSPWLDSFISENFNNLMGLTYDIPIKETGLKYIKNDFIGGRYKSYFKGAKKNKTIKRFVEME